MMFSMKKLNKIIPIGIYPFDLMISFNESDDQIKKSLKRYGVTFKKSSNVITIEMDGIKTKQGRMVMLKGNQSILRLNFMPRLSDPFEMSLLQHEIFHTVGFFMAEINTPLNDDTHEAYAYLVQYLTEKIYQEL